MAESADARRARQRAQRKLAREQKSGQRSESAASRAYRRAIRKRIEARQEDIAPEFLRGQAKVINVLAQAGQSVEVVEIHGLFREDRMKIWEHWNLIWAYLAGTGAEFYQPGNPFNGKSVKELERRIRAYEGKQTGGENSAEFANDPEAIKRHALAAEEDFNFNQLYPVTDKK